MEKIENKKLQHDSWGLSNISHRSPHTSHISSYTSHRSGITLVALVVTIVVLLILAGITITLLFSDNGIIKKAQEAANATEQDKINTEEGLNSLATRTNEILNGGSSIVDTNGFNTSQNVNAPVLTSDMTAIKYDSTSNNWVKVTNPNTDDSWYNYTTDTTNGKKWANVVIGGIFDSSGNLQEVDSDGNNYSYSMFVWIPRYAYSITSEYHNGGSGVCGNIDTKFLKGTTNEDTNGNTTWDNTSGLNKWNIHPAFEYGTNNPIPGIWVAKFEASRSDATVTSEGSNTTLQVKPSVKSWRSISVSDIYDTCLAYNSSLNSHMMKNSEWGAVTYLSQSAYGKNSEIAVNQCSSYITGAGPNTADNGVYASSTYAYSAGTFANTYAYTTTQGLKASSTGNVYGIYDLSGGAWEFVAAYVDNSYTATGGSRNTTEYGASLIAGDAKNKDVYSKGSTDTRVNNYNANSGVYGDAVYEISAGTYDGSTSSTQYLSWNHDFSNFTVTSHPFFERGGYYADTYNAGPFVFSNFSGIAYNRSFRPVLVALNV